MVTTSDMEQTAKYVRQLVRLLGLQQQGGYPDAITGTFNTLSPTQASQLASRITTLLSTLQAQVAALS